MERQELTGAVAKAVAEIQRYSGRPVGALDGRTRPIGDLEGFDSQNGLEVAALLEARLGLTIDYNPLVSEDGRKALRIEEAVNRLAQQMSEG